MDGNLRARLLADAAGDALLAPSAYNSQPWRIHPVDDPRGVGLGWDPRRELPAGDSRGTHLLTSLGAAAECLVLGAAARGHHAEVTYREDPETRQVATVTYGSPLVLPDELAGHLPSRRTTRRAFRRDRVPSAVLDRMAFEASGYGGTLSVLSSRDAVKRAARLVAEGTFRKMADLEVYEEFHRWLRLPAESSRMARDGLTRQALRLGPLVELVGPWLFEPRRVRALNPYGLARAAGLHQGRLASRAPVFCLLTTSVSQPEDWFAGGRAMQRVWLAATAAGLRVHPMTAAMDSPDTRAELAALFGVPTHAGMVVCFRLGYGPEPAPPVRLPATALIASDSDVASPASGSRRGSSPARTWVSPPS